MLLHTDQKRNLLFTFFLLYRTHWFLGSLNQDSNLCSLFQPSICYHLQTKIIIKKIKTQYKSCNFLCHWHSHNQNTRQTQYKSSFTLKETSDAKARGVLMDFWWQLLNPWFSQTVYIFFSKNWIRGNFHWRHLAGKPQSFGHTMLAIVTRYKHLSNSNGDL